MKDLNVPIWHKVALTVDEAVAYSNIGRNQIRWMSNSPDCPFVLDLSSGIFALVFNFKAIS